MVGVCVLLTPCGQFRQVQALALVAIEAESVHQTFSFQRRPDGRQWLVWRGSAGLHSNENKTRTETMGVIF